MIAGFPADEPNEYQLVNHSDSIVVYLKTGNRTLNNQVNYPDDELTAKASPHGSIYLDKDSALYKT